MHPLIDVTIYTPLKFPKFHRRAKLQSQIAIKFVRSRKFKTYHAIHHSLYSRAPTRSQIMPCAGKIQLSAVAQYRMHTSNKFLELMVDKWPGLRVRRGIMRTIFDIFNRSKNQQIQKLWRLVNILIFMKFWKNSKARLKKTECF